MSDFKKANDIHNRVASLNRNANDAHKHPMSEPTPREEQITEQSIRGDVHSIVGMELSGGQIEELVELVQTEVLAVLTRLEEQANEYLTQGIGAGVWEAAVPLDAITQLKQRYGGKEQ